MKRYTKTISGKPVIKERKNIVLRRNGKQIINPSEEMILEEGWKEYITPTYERTLDDYRRDKINEIIRFDSSNEVNGFYIGDIELWLDKATRVGLKLRFDAEIASGKTETVLWYNGTPFPLQLENALQMLNALELYASACYDNTQLHIANIKTAEDVKSIENYNYKTGYPERLMFS